MDNSLYEYYSIIRTLKLKKRRGWQDRHLVADSIAEHMYGAMSIGWKLAMQENSNANHVIELLLVHDWIMALIPDLTPSSGKYLEKNTLEEESKFKIQELLGKDLGKKYISLFLEFKTLKTKEAQIAREADKLETLLQGAMFEKETGKKDILDEFLETYAPIFITRTGRKLFLKIKNDHLNKTI